MFVNLATSLSLLTFVSSVYAVDPIINPGQNKLVRSFDPHYNSNICLSLPASTEPANGVGLIMAPCANATRWDFAPTLEGVHGPITVVGTNFVLDAGDPVKPGNPGKVWENAGGVPQQTWKINGQGSISSDAGYCLRNDMYGVQMWNCAFSFTECKYLSRWNT